MIKQRMFTWTDTYDIYDEKGIPRYYVESEFMSLGLHIHVYEKYTDREVGAVHQRFDHFNPRFEIVIDYERRGTVKRQFSWFRPKFFVDFMGWDVEGDLCGWNYEVYQYGYHAITVQKELLTWGDTYVLDIHDPEDEIPALLLVLTIDAAYNSRR